MNREVAPPSGSPPPVDAPFAGGRVALVPLAEEVARRHLESHPDDVERYGAGLAQAWAVHDMQHVLAWAFADVVDFVDLDRQVGWLARVLDARGYPLANLADCLDIAADVVTRRMAGTDAVSARLREVAAAVRP